MIYLFRNSFMRHLRLPKVVDHIDTKRYNYNFSKIIIKAIVMLFIKTKSKK